MQRGVAQPGDSENNPIIISDDEDCFEVISVVSTDDEDMNELNFGDEERILNCDSSVPRRNRCSLHREKRLDDDLTVDCPVQTPHDVGLLGKRSRVQSPDDYGKAVPRHVFEDAAKEPAPSSLSDDFTQFNINGSLESESSIELCGYNKEKSSMELNMYAPGTESQESAGLSSFEDLKVDKSSLEENVTACTSSLESEGCDINSDCLPVGRAGSPQKRTAREFSKAPQYKQGSDAQVTSGTHADGVSDCCQTGKENSSSNNRARESSSPRKRSGLSILLAQNSPKRLFKNNLQTQAFIKDIFIKDEPLKPAV